MATRAPDTSTVEADHRRRTFGAVVVVVVDQVAKVAALTVLGDGDRTIGPLRFTIVRNQGDPLTTECRHHRIHLLVNRRDRTEGDNA